MRHTSFLILCILTVLNSFGTASLNYHDFKNIFPDAEAASISSITQDNQGVIWIGTIKGLYSYDGYSLHSHNSAETDTDIQIHCSTTSSNLLYLGTDKGILIYDIATDTYVKKISITSSVRALIHNGNILWIGTLNGFYKYDIGKSNLERIDEKGKGLSNQTVYALNKVDNRIFIGTYDGLCIYDLKTKKFKSIDLPKDKGKNNVFVNSLLEDKPKGCIWVGTEGSLYKLALNNLQVERFNKIEYNSVKSLILDNSGNLFIGTDNGLYIYNEKNGVEHIVHDSRIVTSLANNIIWTLFVDRDKNLWIGTDYGISLNRYNRSYNFMPISMISGTGEGNRLNTIFKDSYNTFWFGGENGLIHKEVNGKTVWYKMGNKVNSISHNRIRKIYEDKDRQLWIAGDGSLNRFDRNSKQFYHYTIMDKTGTKNANWCYDVLEDTEGNLWIGSFLGGLFVVDKNKLSHFNNKSYTAEFNITNKNGLPENSISQLIADKNGFVWILTRSRQISKIEMRTKKVENISFSSELKNKKPCYLFCDSDGYVWVGFKGGILRINSSQNQKTTTYFDEFNPKEILNISQENQHLWISTTSAVWIIDRHTLKVVEYLQSALHFSSIFYDNATNKIYMGGVDGYATTSFNMLKHAENEHPIVLTSLYVNNKYLQNLGNNTNSIRYAKDLVFRNNQNNLTFEFSDLEYSANGRYNFIYRLEGLSEQWNNLKQNNNQISYSNLPPGAYTLVIKKRSLASQQTEAELTMPITILPPWYLSRIAKLVYLLMLIGAIIWVINFFIMKNRLKMERIEKERSLEQSKIKMDFFTNISHEFKTPLSLIVAPLAKLRYEVKDPEQKAQILMAHQNAMKINTLIHQALDFDKIDNRINPRLLPSKVEFIEFAQSLFNVFKEASKDSGQNFSFSSNCKALYVDVDVVKMESVLNNVISNAVKFTPSGGNISLSIEVDSTCKVLSINTKDTGEGIAANDLPHIFQRFYQASKTKHKIEGTGIGLYLVKTYTELHNGAVSIQSKENEGTSITITIPIKNHHQTASPSIESTTVDKNAPLILVVEDNNDIADIICNSLGKEFRFIKASNGKAGLNYAIENLPDIIITDLMMPVMNGVEMCKGLRKNIQTATIPIVLLTAKENSEIEKDMVLLNIDSYFSKPFDPEMLKIKVNNILSKNRILEEKVRIEALSTPKQENITSVNEKFLSEIISIIEENISNSEFNVNELCSIADISNKQLYRRIKQLTGYTPVDYIKSIRMKKAAMLLEQKKFTIAEVMYMVGFSNHSYFSKCFQAVLDKTPKAYVDDLM